MRGMENRGLQSGGPGLGKTQSEVCLGLSLGSSISGFLWGTHWRTLGTPSEGSVVSVCGITSGKSVFWAQARRLSLRDSKWDYSRVLSLAIPVFRMIAKESRLFGGNLPLGPQVEHSDLEPTLRTQSREGILEVQSGEISLGDL